MEEGRIELPITAYQTVSLPLTYTSIMGMLRIELRFPGLESVVFIPLSLHSRLKKSKPFNIKI